MMYFCTLFDSNYLNKGIALYLSLEKHADNFVLYVMGLDRKCHNILSALNFKHLVVECIEDIESVELSEAKSNRSRAEFCWTCGSFVTDYFLHRYNLPDITYLDSDLMFFSSPKCIYDELELNNASVGIVPHFTRSSLFGKYCVQYVYFKNDEDGRACLTWWKDRCIEWCYSILDDGKYGDQKYLDYFGERFKNVYVISNRGVGIAYWNMYTYKYQEYNISYKNQTYPVVFFHYSGINIKNQDSQMTFSHTMYISSKIKHLFVVPYADLMKLVYELYLHVPVSTTTITPINLFKYCLKYIIHILNKFFPINSFIDLINRIKYRTRHAPYSENK